MKTIDPCKLSSVQQIPHTIKGGKEFADKIQDSAQIASLLKAYADKYGYNDYIRLLVSTYSDIHGGWSFNQSRSCLAHDVETRDLR